MNTLCRALHLDRTDECRGFFQAWSTRLCEGIPKTVSVFVDAMQFENDAFKRIQLFFVGVVCGFKSLPYLSPKRVQTVAMRNLFGR